MRSKSRIDLILILLIFWHANSILYCADAYPVPLSLQAAVATEAATLQGKFWHMHDMIYEQQKYLTRTSFSQFAREIDLDTSLFEDPREHRKLFRKVIGDFESGVKSGVDSSPTFFINGVRYDGFADFDSLLLALQNVNPYEYSVTDRTIGRLR